MFTKNNKVYSEAFSYLRNGRINAVALAVSNPEGWEEIEMPEDLRVEVEEHRDDEGNLLHYDAYFVNRLFIIRLPTLDYGEVKKTIIQRRYSMDDQMAIQLNKDKSEEYLREYERMQEWREFSAYLAKEIERKYNHT